MARAVPHLERPSAAAPKDEVHNKAASSSQAPAGTAGAESSCRREAPADDVGGSPKAQPVHRERLRSPSQGDRAGGSRDGGPLVAGHRPSVPLKLAPALQLPSGSRTPSGRPPAPTKERGWRDHRCSPHVADHVGAAARRSEAAPRRRHCHGGHGNNPSCRRIATA